MIGLYIAYMIPIYLRWRKGDAFEPGPWTLGRKYKWMSPSRSSEVLIVVVILQPAVSSAGVPWNDDFDWNARQLHADRDRRGDPGGRDLVARQREELVQGPAHTVDETRQESLAASEAPSRPETLLSVLEPATEAGPRRGPRAGVEEADAAVARAAAALPGLARGRARPTARGCCPARDASEDDLEELALLEARNAGKPIGDARGEIGMVVETFRYYAGAPERLLGDTIPVAGGVAMTFREPLGVVGADHAVELPAGDRGVEARARRSPPATRSCSSPPS